MHYDDVIMTTLASQITSLTVVSSIVCLGVDKKKTSKLRVTGLCAGNSPGPVNSQHKGPVTRKMFPFDGVIMDISSLAFPRKVSTISAIASYSMQERYKTKILIHIPSKLSISPSRFHIIYVNQILYPELHWPQKQLRMIYYNNIFVVFLV